MALAIELTAARVPSLGLDGIEAGLADRLRLLAGGPRIDDRHRSLRSALDWSYALLDEPDQAVLRRVSVFAGPFTADAAEAVLSGWQPVAGGAIPAVLAGLVEQSLLTAVPGRAGTRYRAPETIRQYGADLLADAGESAQAQARHLSWALDAAGALGLDPEAGVGGWRLAFDQVADDLRSSLGWAAGHAPHRQEAHELAISLAELSFARGMPGESQARYEEAAALAADERAGAAALHCAAGAAEARHFGTEALRLRRAAADAALRAGDRAAAAVDLARAAELINRGPGMLSARPPAGAAEGLLAQARDLAAGDLAAQARTLTAEAFNHAEADPATVELVNRAMTLARQAGDPLTESAALDQLTSVQLARGEVRAAAASAMRRLELLAPLQATPASGMEFSDAFSMATECTVAAGDLRTARQLAECVRDLPFHREEGHLATARLIVVTALAGDWDEALTLAERFREGWEQAGRPRAGNLTRGAYAAATVHGLRGDGAARSAWLAIVDAVATPGTSLRELQFGEYFDALLALHRGRTEQALRSLDTPPEEFNCWHNGMWRPWYAAVWAEAAVIAGRPDAADRISRAQLMTLDNPIAAAIVDRAAALAGNGDGLMQAAAALEAAGCRYQWARTLVMTGGAQRTQGETVLAAMGATAMA